ncbi:hypothetical protein GSU68_15575 [Rathayibacter sp. VKM Ac-2759]|uniref:hypothetical protein n=1 Tax=Rathayibacter sp. VKM Ac-2759 TaxID=2609252 RepID=UPI001316DE73|nr:hypothetical protein [Rathayibacter sp. VKM Ac-2759]QHC67849.1 hypothetical protein GSU68_15575 [Rathayibacter sp. VKM Ac-2759]
MSSPVKARRTHLIRRALAVLAVLCLPAGALAPSAGASPGFLDGGCTLLQPYSQPLAPEWEDERPYLEQMRYCTQYPGGTGSAVVINRSDVVWSFDTVLAFLYTRFDADRPTATARDRRLTVHAVNSARAFMLPGEGLRLPASAGSFTIDQSLTQQWAAYDVVETVLDAALDEKGLGIALRWAAKGDKRASAVRACLGAVSDTSQLRRADPATVRASLLAELGLPTDTVEDVVSSAGCLGELSSLAEAARRKAGQRAPLQWASAVEGLAENGALLITVDDRLSVLLRTVMTRLR